MNARVGKFVNPPFAAAVSSGQIGQIRGPQRMGHPHFVCEKVAVHVQDRGDFF
jgi:hypothetical protein